MILTLNIYIVFDMANYRYQLPSMSVLSAFECAGRLNSFSRAAEELGSSQPAISRHIASLENALGVKLFTRNRGRVSLTSTGQKLYHSVVVGLEEVALTIRDIQSQRRGISIACSHSISHLWLMPRYDRLQEALGEDVEIVTITSEYEYHSRLQEEGVDLNLTFAGEAVRRMDKTLLFKEEIFPVCSPAFAERHRSVITDKGVSALEVLPLLRLGQRNYGWATWETWFEKNGLNLPDMKSGRRFGNYVYMLEAACNGNGVALGWKELVDDYLSQERLIDLPGARLTTGGGLYLVVNPLSRSRSLVEQAAGLLKSI